MKALIIVMFVLCGCVPVEVVAPLANPDVIQVGDSLCAEPNATVTAAKQNSIAIDCVAGRRLIDYGNLPSGYRVIFLGLATNDIIYATPLNDYRASLQAKLLTTDSTVYCILAVLRDRPEQAQYNQIMREECVNVIDPRDYGILTPSNPDGVHWLQDNSDNFVLAISGRL